MAAPRPEDFARQFPENGMKLLLQEGLNVHDLLAMGQWPLVDDIDFAHMATDPTTYVQRDYRALAGKGCCPTCTRWYIMSATHANTRGCKG